MSVSVDDTTAPLNGVHSDTPPPAPAVPFEPALFRTYLLLLLPPLMGASMDELEMTLFDGEFDERVVKFAAEGATVIYVVKIKEEVDGM